MITLNDVLEAKKRIAPYVIHTPLLRVPAMDEMCGCKVYIKPENLQKTGSFKLRGAANAMLALSEEEKARGVVACSSGNHAQGVACAAKLLGVSAVIVMPENANPAKLEGTKGYGAEVVLAGLLGSERDKKAAEIAETQGRTMIHPYADDFVKAGQGTMGLEILEDEPEMDVIVTPIGGGGMISGIATAAKGIKPGIRIFGTEPTGAPRYRLSREAKKPVTLSHVDTIADGTRTDHADPGNFAIIECLVDDLISVTDEEIRMAMNRTIRFAKIVAEPSSSMPIAAALAGKLPVKPEDKVCFVVSGGNNDMALLKEIL
ncbi:MAG: threonine/serine dehydratase [Clostridium sp.]|nr:threonine/serine dehydratase [Clostridium sp.]MBP3215522.1 threonine/serine dehydratase [Clostridium sp.]